MSNPEQPKQELPEYILDKKVWDEKINEAIEEKNWLTSDLLGEHLLVPIEKGLSFKDLPENEREVFLQETGRMLSAFMGYTRTRYSVIEKARCEIKDLLDKTGTPVENTAPFMELIYFLVARENNSNTFGNNKNTFFKVIQDVAHYSPDKIANPFELSDGTEIFKFNEKTKSIESFPIEVLAENGKGLVVFGEGEKGQEDLHDFNLRLARGEYMKKDGSNYFGGIEYLKKATNVSLFQEGAELTMDFSTPWGKGKNIQKVTIVSTNERELQEKYGNSYLSFIDQFPVDKGIFTATIKTQEGKIIENIDIRDLKIVGIAA